jgi:hypothetical protein
VPTWLIIFIVVVLVLAIGGYFARKRQLERTESVFRERLERANLDLADAHAADKGWEPSVVEGAARRLFAEQRGSDPGELELWQVIDRPGTDDDKIVFRADGALLTLGRRDGEWVFESLE